MQTLVFLLALVTFACGPRAQPAGYGAADAHTFVEEHRQELEQDIRVGSGEALYQLAIVADCQNVAEVGRFLHRQYTELFGSPSLTDAEIAGRIVKLIEGRRELRCLDLDISRQRMFAAGRRHVGPRR